MKPHPFKRSAILALLAGCACTAAHAADWSDTSLSYRYGTKFAEPFNNQDIAKNIVNLSGVSGYKYGTNFFSVDFLMSDDKDPSSVGAKSGAHEAYALYRHTLDLGKVTGNNYAFGPVRGMGVTAGLDFHSKTDAGYNSKRRMLVAGPALMFAVPGFLNVSLLALWESNAPYNGYSNTAVDRYRYKTHPMLTAAWGIPIGAGIPLSFEGFANFIGTKGKDEFGGDTATETNIDMQIMYDVGAAIGSGKNVFKVGVEYQYWKNKFGNSDHNNPGATAKTPMIRAEYHF